MELSSLNYNLITIILPESRIDSQPSNLNTHKKHLPSKSVRRKRLCKTRQYYNELIAVPAKEAFLGRNTTTVNDHVVNASSAFEFFDWYLDTYNNLPEQDRVRSAVMRLKQNQYDSDQLSVIKNLVSEEVFTLWEQHWFDHTSPHLSSSCPDECTDCCEYLDTDSDLKIVSDGRFIYDECTVMTGKNSMVHLQSTDSCDEITEHIYNQGESVDVLVYPNDTLKVKHCYGDMCASANSELVDSCTPMLGLMPRLQSRGAQARIKGQPNIRIYHFGRLVGALYTERIDILTTDVSSVYNYLYSDVSSWYGSVPSHGTIIVINPYKYSRWKWRRCVV